MGKEALVYHAEAMLKQLEENDFKLLFTTNGFKLLGIVTWDRKVHDESMGIKRRMIKGLRIEDDHPLPNKDRIVEKEERVFTTFLDRKNPLSGQLDSIVVHEDGHIILTERKSFELDDSEENFQFMKNMKWYNRIQELLDEIDATHRRIDRLKEEKEEVYLDVEHYRSEAQAAKEKTKTISEVNIRLTRENAVLQEQIGNLRAAYSHVRSTNLKHEAMIDEKMAGATEEGTIRGMSSDDLMIHAAEKKAELHRTMHEISPESTGIMDELQYLTEKVESLEARLSPAGSTPAPKKEATIEKEKQD